MTSTEQDSIQRKLRRSSKELQSIKGLPRIIPTGQQAKVLAAYAAQSGKRSEHILALCEAADEIGDDEALPCSSLNDYAAVSRLVKPVTGRSLLDSLSVDTHTLPVRRFAFWTLLIIVLSGMLKAFLSDYPRPEDEESLIWIFWVQEYVLDYIGPFLWGALGSCVYLLKRYSDLAEESVFDRDSRQGWGTRVLLGAILGGVVQYLYDSSVFTNSGFNLDANALGFLSGVGVKVVYGAVEKTINALAEAMNLNAIRKAKSEDEVTKFLADQLAAEQDPDIRDVLTDLIKRRSDP